MENGAIKTLGLDVDGGTSKMVWLTCTGGVVGCCDGGLVVAQRILGASADWKTLHCCDDCSVSVWVGRLAVRAEKGID